MRSPIKSDISDLGKIAVSGRHEGATIPLPEISLHEIAIKERFSAPRKVALQLPKKEYLLSALRKIDLPGYHEGTKFRHSENSLFQVAMKERLFSSNIVAFQIAKSNFSALRKIAVFGSPRKNEFFVL